MLHRASNGSLRRLVNRAARDRCFPATASDNLNKYAQYRFGTQPNCAEKGQRVRQLQRHCQTTPRRRRAGPSLCPRMGGVCQKPWRPTGRPRRSVCRASLQLEPACCAPSGMTGAAVPAALPQRCGCAGQKPRMNQCALLPRCHLRPYSGVAPQQPHARLPPACRGIARRAAFPGLARCRWHRVCSRFGGARKGGPASARFSSPGPAPPVT